MWSWVGCCRTDPIQSRTAPLRAPLSPRPVGSSLPHWVQVALPLWDPGQLPAAGWLRCPPRRDITSFPKSQLPPSPPTPALEWKWEGQCRDSEESLWFGCCCAQLARGEESGERFQCFLPPSGPLRGPPAFLLLQAWEGVPAESNVISGEDRGRSPHWWPTSCQMEKESLPARPATPGKIVTSR